MRPRQDPGFPLLELARAQSGVLHSAQVRELGLGRHSVARLIESGHWQRVDRGIFAVGQDRPGWLGLAWAGVLLGGPDSRLAGRSAAYLHTFGPEQREVEVLVPHDRVMTDRPPWTFHRERPGVRDARSPGSPPRTTVEDTVLDLVDLSSADEALHWVTAAVQNRRTTAPRLRRALEGRRKLRHRHLLEALLADVAQGAETPLEVTYLRDVERAHGLPRGVRQHRSRRGGHLRDVLYEEFATVVELDGRLGHEGQGRFRDMARDNAAAMEGELTLRYGWPDVNDRCCLVARQVGAVLSYRGWRDFMHACDRCRRVPLGLVG